jgi:hypothetical protein
MACLTRGQAGVNAKATLWPPDPHESPTAALRLNLPWLADNDVVHDTGIGFKVQCREGLWRRTRCYDIVRFARLAPETRSVFGGCRTPTVIRIHR